MLSERLFAALDPQIVQTSRVGDRVPGCRRRLNFLSEEFERFRVNLSYGARHARRDALIFVERRREFLCMGLMFAKISERREFQPPAEGSGILLGFFRRAEQFE